VSSPSEVREAGLSRLPHFFSTRVAATLTSGATLAFVSILPTAATSAAGPSLAAVKGSLTATTDRVTGAHTAAQMSVEIALAPRDQAGLSQSLTEVYTEGSSQYHQWLAKGQFDASYAPSAAERDAVEGYLRGQGLTVSPTDSPFLIRATGSSARITAALHTTLSDYVSGQGVRFYANSTAVSLPSSIVGDVEGVVGLTDTVRLHSLTARPAGATAAKPAASTAASSPALTNITIDGGPLAPLCPATDTCPADYNGYSGDIEVDADIEQEMSVAKDAHLLVYGAPNDETGQTELDEYTAIADEDIASTVSSSWGECENDAGQGFAEAENTVFEQMALQGQSMFAAAGDDGAFDCLDTDGTNVVNVDDPGSQPWVTSVGGTSFESDNPGASSHPGYPADGTETVWNPDNLCSDHAKAAANDKLGGYYWCGDYGVGAGGGGSSEFWGAPSYQRGPGVISKYTTHGPTSCVLASGLGTPCRQVPDVSPTPTSTPGTPSTARATRAPPTATAPRSPTAAAGS
jgi:subtilase family serine protease